MRPCFWLSASVMILSSCASRDIRPKSDEKEPSANSQSVDVPYAGDDGEVIEQSSGTGDPTTEPKSDPIPDQQVSGPDEREITKEQTSSESGEESCRPLRHMVFKLNRDFPLPCGGDNRENIISATIPERGRALALFQGNIKTNGNAPTHFWNYTVKVGKPTYMNGIGDDVCVGLPSQLKANFGIGELTDANPAIEVKGHAGSTLCKSGFLVVKAGASLNVWVEDERPSCQGKYLGVSSWIKTNGPKQLYTWSPKLRLVTSLNTNFPEGSDVMAVAVVEGTPTNYERCNSFAGSLTMQVTANDVVKATKKGIIPGSAQGSMTHLALHVLTSPFSVSGETTFKLLVGKSIENKVTTGGCCGDGAVAFIRLK